MKEIVKVLTLKQSGRWSSVDVGERQGRIPEKDAGRHLT